MPSVTTKGAVIEPEALPKVSPEEFGAAATITFTGAEATERSAPYTTCARRL
jgi:hypothetical protein